MENSEVKKDYEKKMIEEELFYSVEQILKLDPLSKKYDYELVKEILIKYLTNKLNFVDLIKPEEIFNLFLVKFRTEIMCEEIESIMNEVNEDKKD